MQSSRAFNMPRSQQEREHSEGTVAKLIEQQTAKLPSDLFLWAGLGAMGLSWILQFTGRRHAGNFVGQWVPTLLILGVYDKIVKVAGSDMEDQRD